jgi:hypothetical protein
MRCGRIGVACVVLLALAGCSRASLLGGPGPEVADHVSPAQSERLAVLEEVRKFKSKEACKAHLTRLAHGAELVEVSAKEVRAYHAQGSVAHEYSCADKVLLERSWKTDGELAHAAAGHQKAGDAHADDAGSHAVSDEAEKADAPH